MNSYSFSPAGRGYGIRVNEDAFEKEARPMAELANTTTAPSRIVVTGGSSGIGLAVARHYAAEGAVVGIIGRSDERLARARAELAGEPGDVRTAAADVGDESALTAAVRDLGDELGGIDLLVCSAGIDGEMGAACEEVTTDSFREVLDVNVVGAFVAVRTAIPFLKESPCGSVVLIGSDSGFVSVPGMLAYNASKGALVQLTRALAVELHDAHGIRVNSVCPSIVDTPLAREGLGVESFEHVDYPVQSAEDIAWSVAYLASPRSRAVNGVNLLSDFGYTGRSSFPA